MADDIAGKACVLWITFKTRPQEKIYDDIVKKGRVDSLTRLLAGFLKKFKSGNYTIEDCEERAEALNFGERGRAFLRIFEYVLAEYKKRLGEKIDFEDMLSRAAGYVEAEKYISPFRHILMMNSGHDPKSSALNQGTQGTAPADAHLCRGG